MLQRIQSVYLFIVTVLMALMTFMPIGGFLIGTDSIVLKMCGFCDSTSALASAWGLVLTVIPAAILPFVTIFLYKKRLLQFRLCVVEMILLCGVILFEIFYMWMGYRNFSDLPLTAASIRMAALFPVISLIFTWLALRGVKKDIMLLKSMDRIR